MKYILGIDQSTQGTKAILVDETGKITARADRSHKQIVNEKGWVSHDLNEIYQNVILASKEVIEKTGASKNDICAGMRKSITYSRFLCNASQKSKTAMQILEYPISKDFLISLFLYVRQSEIPMPLCSDKDATKAA